MSQPSVPVIVSPHSGLDFTTNRTTVTLGGTVQTSGVAEVLVNGSPDGVTYVVDSGVWTADVTLAAGANTFSITAMSFDVTPLESDPAEIEITFSEDLGLSILNPTGIIGDVLKDAVRLTWVENEEPQVVGYNIYGSLTPGGGEEGYLKLNSLLLSTVVEVRTESVPVSETIDQVGDLRTTVTVEQIQTTNIYGFTVTEFDGEPLAVGQTLHLVVTAVGFDTGTSSEIESAYSTEISLTPLILSEARVDAPTRTQQQIAEAYGTLMRQAQPNLDLKPGTPTNEVHIQPPATEQEKLYFLLDFLSKSQSLVELMAIDDPNGDGISDAVDTAPYKVALREALSTDSNEVVQAFIDAAFTRQASNYGVERESAQSASGSYLFYIGASPVSDVVIPAGSIVAAPGNAEQGVATQQYVTTISKSFPLATMSANFNPVTDRFEFPSFIQASSPGSGGNQEVGAINTVVSGPNVSLQGENTTVFINGTDTESNADLALRTIVALLGIDSGTRGGYIKTALAIPQVERARVVGPGRPEMQRDFDIYRREHEAGVVDVYIKGEIPLDHTDQSAFSYYRAEANELTVVSAANFVFEVDVNTDLLSVSDERELFEVTEVRNVTQSVDYDVHRTRFDGKQFTMDTTLPGNSGLVSTDVVQATFRWRDGDKIILSTQPVDSVSSVVGAVSGAMTAGENYNFDKSADPLDLGRSSRSTDGVVIEWGPGPTVTNESHTLTGSTPSRLELPDIYLPSISVTDLSGEIVYVEGEDYELDTYQIVLFEDEEHLASNVTVAYLDHDTVIESTVIVKAGATPVVMTEGVDYTLVVTGLQIGVLRIAGGGISEGETIYVTYRVETPILVTDILRLVAVTPASGIGDGDTVLVDYRQGKPRGRPILVEGEEHVLVGEEFVELDQKGVIAGTVVVIDPLSASPAEYMEGIDYVLEEGSDDEATQIRRLDSGSIPDGGTVEVTYRVNEQFTIVYAGNDLVRVVQDRVEIMRHVTADVLVKEALGTGIDISATIVPFAGVNELTLVNAIRTAISRHLISLDLGAGIFLANIIKVIEDVTGVDHTVVASLLMSRSEGSLVLREVHRNPEWTLWASGIADAYRSQAGTLEFATTAGGGSRYLPRGVFEDDSPMSLVEDIGEVEEAFGRAYIAADGSVVISPIDGLPENHVYTVTYQVGVEQEAKDIRLTALEYAELGTVSISLADPEATGDEVV